MNKYKNKGFTLVELLIAIVIMGIIVILALPSLRSFLTKNEEKEYMTLRNSIISAAKLYTDSSNEDMFGSNNSGCVMLTYNQLKAKDLIKEYEQDGLTCSTFSTIGLDGVNRPFINSWTYYGEEDSFCKGLDASSKVGDICPEYDYGVEGNSNNQSFVRVYKVGNYYHYQYAIDCYKKNKKVFTENTIQGECLNVEDQSPPTIIFKKNGSNNEFYQNFKIPINIYDQSTLSQTVSIKYAWITTGNTQDKIVNPYLSTINRKANISKASYGDDNEVNPLIREQLINLDGTEKMINWKTKTLKVKKNGTDVSFTVKSQENMTGAYYLVVKPVYAEDGIHNSWAGFKYAGEEKDGNYYWISNPVLLDNTPPTIDENDITMINKECNEKDNDYNTAHGKCTLIPEDASYISDSWTNRYVEVSLESTNEDFSGVGYYTYKTEGATTNQDYCEKDDIECHDKNYLDMSGGDKTLKRKIKAEGISYITFKACDNTTHSKENNSEPNCATYHKKIIKTDYTSPTNNLTYKFYDNVDCTGTEIHLNDWTKNGGIKASGSQDNFGGDSTLTNTFKETSGISNYQYIYRGSSNQGTIVNQEKENDGVGQCSKITIENKTKEQYTNIIYSICDNVHNCSNYVTESLSQAKAKLNIDRTPPTCTSLSDNTNWTKNNVSIHGTCTDGLSGCSQATIDKIVSVEGDKNTSPGIAKDKAGNETPCPTVNTKIDKTPPTCTSNSDTINWTKNNVTIHGTCTDNISGCSQAKIDKTITDEGNKYTSPGKIKDNAGNETPCPDANTKIDRTPPTCTSTSDNTNWTKNNVIIRGKCTDSISGCSADNISSTITTQGNNNTSPGKVKDNAGNETTCPNANTKIDKTPPKCTISSNGDWNTTGAKVKTTCSKNDSYSDIATCQGSGGATITGNVTYSVTDKAGNSNTCKYTVSKQTQYRKSTRTCSNCYTGSTCEKKREFMRSYSLRYSPPGADYYPPNAPLINSSECDEHERQETANGKLISCMMYWWPAGSYEGYTLYKTECYCILWKEVCENTCQYGCSGWSAWSAWGGSGNSCNSNTCKSESRIIYK